MSTFDFHAHCFPEFLAKRAVTAIPFITQSQGDGTWDDLLALMKRHDVPHCVGLNMATRPNTMHKVNLFAVSSMRPGHAVFGSVHPDAPDAIAELEWLYEQGIRGVKLHTGYQVFDFDNPRYFDIYRKIGELGMATTIHCGPFLDTTEHLVYPGVVAKAIDCFDGAPFVCAHMGGVDPDHPEFELLKSLPVYVDTALAHRMMTREQFARFVVEFGNDRVLFGTDMPWENPETLIRWMNPVFREHPEINARAIFYDNAMELCSRIAPEKWARWRENDFVMDRETSRLIHNPVLAWYNNDKE